MKDWKLELDEENNKAWYNFEKSQVVRFENEKRGIANTPYQIYILSHGLIKSHKYFKTRSQALSFAKSHMRTH